MVFNATFNIFQLNRGDQFYWDETGENETTDLPQATDKCGRSLSAKIPVDMNNIFMKLYVT